MDGFFADWKVLAAALRETGRTVVETAAFFRPEAEVAALTAPFMGGEDPLWGRRAFPSITLRHFLALDGGAEAANDTVVVGEGAYLVAEALGLKSAHRAWAEVPKNEIQYADGVAMVAINGSDAAAVVPSALLGVAL